MKRFALMAVCSAVAFAQTGEAVYKNVCAKCHESEDAHAPPISSLQALSSARILRTLDFGAMMAAAGPLTRAEREAVASYLGKGQDSHPLPASAFCASRTVTISKAPKAVWNGWSPTTANTRFQATPGLTLDQVKNLKLKWTFGYDGDVNAFAAPAILDNQLFVGSANGMVHALDAKSGCIRWQFQADGPVRTAMLVVPNGAKHALLFGDQTGWFYSVEAETGKLEWKKRPEAHEATKLTGAPVANNGVVYVPVASWEENRPVNPEYKCCSFRGSVLAYRIKDGQQLWKTYVIDSAAGAGIWSAPTLDLKRKLVYVTTGNDYAGPSTEHSDAVVALDMATGKIIWWNQVTPGDIFNGGCANARNCPGPDFDFGSSAILEKLPDGHDVLLAGQKSGMVYALDPDAKGKMLWKARAGKGGTNGGVQWGMASDGQRVYAAVSDLNRIRNTDPLDPRPSGADRTQGGGLTALRISDGTQVWHAAPVPCRDNQPICSPAQPQAVTAIPGVVFSGSVDGHMRAFAAEDGRVLWDFDTAKTWPTVNGVYGRGGSLDGPGAVVAGGMVYVNSGYSRNGGMAGNVLLVFSVE